MKEIGEELKQLRKKAGVDLEEASHDLNISEIELECIEAGNSKAFKDIYDLKDKVKLYAKYLGIDEDRIADEFNDFLFEKTSKISVNDVKNYIASDEALSKSVINKTAFADTNFIYLLEFKIVSFNDIKALIKNEDKDDPFVIVDDE